MSKAPKHWGARHYSVDLIKPEHKLQTFDRYRENGGTKSRAGEDEEDTKAEPKVCGLLNV